MPKSKTSRKPASPRAKRAPKKESVSKVTARALLQIRVPGDPDVSSDGRRVAFTVTETDWEDNAIVTHLHMQRRSANPKRDEPRQVTFGKASESVPRFSPDGKWLAFLREPSDEDDEDGAEGDPKKHPQVWRLPLDGLGGEAEAWTDAPEGVATYEWLPDSQGIVYLAREPRPPALKTRYEREQEERIDSVVEHEEKFRMQIWAVGLAEKRPRLIHAGDYGIGEITVSPDGKTVAFSTNYTGEPNDYLKIDIWVVDIVSGHARPLTEGPGGKYHPRFSPNGHQIAYLRTLDPALSYSQLNLFTVSLAGGESRLVTTDFPYDITGWPGYEWVSDDSLIIQAAVGVNTCLYRWTLTSPQPSPWKGEGEKEGHVQVFRIGGRRRGVCAYTWTDDTHPPELYVDGRPITALNARWSKQHAVLASQTVYWEAPDARRIEGLITTPSEGQPPYPLIVAIHGGPYARSIRALAPSSLAQVYAARGYAVFRPNYRGSEGYGDEFGRANREDLGGADYQDIMSGVDWLVAQGITDPDKLAVMGASYGGYMTNWIIGHTDRFKAAVSQFGIFSLVTDFSNSEAPRWEEEYMGGFYWERLDTYLARSPMTYLSAIKTPVLIMHGEADTNTFIANSREMYTALRALGSTVQFVHYPREGHGFAEPNHRLDEARRVLAWLDKYVLGQTNFPRLGDKITNKAGWELMVTSARAGAKYAGRPDPPGDTHYLEVVFILRDKEERRLRLTLAARDARLSPAGAPEASAMRPVGVPIEVLGESVLAQARSFRFTFAPPKDDKSVRGLAVPLALTFAVPKSHQTFTLSIADFPPVLLDAEGGIDDEDDS